MRADVIHLEPFRAGHFNQHGQHQNKQLLHCVLLKMSMKKPRCVCIVVQVALFLCCFGLFLSFFAEFLAFLICFLNISPAFFPRELISVQHMASTPSYTVSIAVFQEVVNNIIPFLFRCTAIFAQFCKSSIVIKAGCFGNRPDFTLICND